MRSSQLRLLLSSIFRPHGARWALSSVALLLPLTCGCGRHSEASPIAAANPAPPAIQITRPVRQTLSCTIEQPGWIQAFEQTPIYAKIPGYLQKVNVEIGTQVHKGDLLAELWVPEMVEELKRKEAAIVQAQAGIEQAEKALRAAEAATRSAEAKVKEAEAGRLRVQAELERAQSQYERLERVSRSGVLDNENIRETRYGFQAAKAAVQEVESQVASARAAVDEAKAKRDKAGADVSVAKAHLQVANADRDHSKALLRYAQISAPFDGIVSQRHVDTGHFVQPASGSDKGEPLFVVTRTDLVRVFVEIPEADAVFVCAGRPAHIHIQALNWRVFEGKVAGCSWALEPSERTLRTEIDLPNREGVLRPGMYPYASIDIERPNTLTIPATALARRDDDQWYCYCAEQGKAIRTDVRIGIRQGSRIELIKKRRSQGAGDKGIWQDFTGQEEIILGNPANLSDGVAVTVSRGKD
jgi:HlyD family secretion protein